MTSLQFVSRFSKLLTCAALTTSFCWSAMGEEEAQPLPKPSTEAGMSLTEALQKRCTQRKFSDRELTPQELSDLLWAACGVNREDGRRTAPTARNKQEIEVYVATAKGVWLYDALANTLKPILKEDIRALTGSQPFVATAPVNLIFVADRSQFEQDGSRGLTDLPSVDTGFIGQNVYLHCAAKGMATVFRGLVDRDALGKKLNLPATHAVTYAQSVGFPAQD
jgi:nitroreductase